MHVLKEIRTALVVLVTGIVAVLAASLAVVPSASAASHDAELLVKGPAGSAYTRGYLVSQVGNEGATLTYTFQVRNTGSTLAQYRIRVNDWTGAQAHVYDGSLLLKPLASSPDGYYTKPLGPGAAQTLTVRIAVPGGTATYEHYSSVDLFATDGYYLDAVTLVAEEPSVLAGSTSRDLFVKQGGQAAIAGPGRNYQISTAPTIASTQAASYTAILQNSTSPTPTSIGFLLDPGFTCPGATITVKDGALDVTAAALAGNYQSPPLAKAAKRNLTITVKNLGSCTFSQIYVSAKVPGGSVLQTAILQVNKAA